MNIMNVDDQRRTRPRTGTKLTDITNRLDALERKLDLILTKLDGVASDD